MDSWRDDAGKKFSLSNILFHMNHLLRNLWPATLHYLRRSQQRAGYFYSRAVDRRKTIVPPRLLTQIQKGTLGYEYRGVPCAKNPFDLAIYLKLLWDLKPGTIIEIGSLSGGSGLFFSDQSRLLGLDTTVWSFDINPVTGMDTPTLRFLEADIHSLSDSALPKILQSAPRPWLVIEDGPHTYSGCKAALAFFHQFLEAGDYIVVEDGNLRELGYLSLEDGPNRAIKEFMASHAADYEVDRNYCDLFGQNVTWNTDGYLRRVG